MFKAKLAGYYAFPDVSADLHVTNFYSVYCTVIFRFIVKFKFAHVQSNRKFALDAVQVLNVYT